MIVEDGSLVADANSLCSLAFADGYHGDRGHDTWLAASVADREAALVRATDFLCQSYAGRWYGSKVEPTQALCWPRQGIINNEDYEYPATVIPTQIKQAVAIYAFDGLTQELTASTERPKKQVAVGPISVTYEEGTQSSGEDRLVRNLLRELADVGLEGVRMSVSMW